MNQFILRRLLALLCVSGLLVASTETMASAFQLWEQDGASEGNVHAGYAAIANDASTAWYNPAGITRIKNQQVVVGAAGISSDFQYNGAVNVSSFGSSVTFDSISAQGGSYNILPSLHYVAPINDWIGFGFSVAVPFGLKTDYGRTTPLQYASTQTSITVIDISPSLGFKLTDKFSVGAGLDIQKVYGKFDSVAALLVADELQPEFDTTSTNDVSDTGYGYHAGVLYEFTPSTRAGLSYHSQVTHHLTGTSRFEGPLADPLSEGISLSSRAISNITLPAYTALSGYHLLNPSWAIMSTVMYTQWNTFDILSLTGVSGIDADMLESHDISVTVPEHFNNSWSASVGADYYASESVMLRGGLGYDQTPVRNRYRNAMLPDNDRIIVGLGGHYQATKVVGLDLSWLHVFIRQANINPPPLVLGAQTVLTNGSVNGSANVVSGQITWDII